jgi:lipoprotein-anchoring transpeptidase ErfK/SrfK
MTRRLLPILILSLAVLVSPAAASAAAPPLKPATDHGPLGNETLSNETTLTRWGHTNLLGAVRKEPTTSSKAIDKLHWNTEDRVPEVYIALESRLDDKGEAWIKIRVPGRPNGRTGWVREEQLSNLKVVRTHLTIDRGALKATLKRKGKKIWTSRVGVGKASTPTPAGNFWIRERLSNLGGSPVYGPWAFGTSAYSDQLTDWPGGGVVGIHGTNQPELIPGRPSHGCVRVPNANIRKLKRLMPVGTPLTIK